jgi:hypothetical protein
MRIVSPAHFPDMQKINGDQQSHPHQSIFYDQLSYTDQLDLHGQNVPELSSIRLNKKLFNNRLQNNPEDLKKLVKGAMGDIREITRLVQSLQSYRSQFNDIKSLAKQASNV